MSENKPVQLGLCCLNTTLKKQKPPVYASRKIIVRVVKEKGIEELKRRILLNLEDLLKMIQWNEDNGIKVFRLSSELFPHKTNPKIDSYDLDFAKEHLQKVGELAKSYNQRLTFHPGQFNVLATLNKNALKMTLNDLIYHSQVLDMMGLGKDSVMVIHGGGIYGDKESAIQRWSDNYKNLPPSVKKRLVLENCEKCYSIEDCLKINEEKLRSIGLSKQKITYIYNVSEFFINNQNQFNFHNMSEQDIRKKLISIKGIGPWTIDMFMMFTIFKLDVLPLGDLGIKKAFKELFNLDKLPSDKFMTVSSEKWRPYRTIACCYLWMIVDDGDVW